MRLGNRLKQERFPKRINERSPPFILLIGLLMVTGLVPGTLSEHLRSSTREVVELPRRVVSEARK